MAVSEKKINQLKKRQDELQLWFQGILPSIDGKTGAQPHAVLQALSGDASFRRYFTSCPGRHTYVLVDAPPDKEDNRTFILIAEKFLAAGINVPRVYDVNYEKGFMCLSYLGDTLLWQQLDALRTDNLLSAVNAIYREAFDILVKIQNIRVGSDILLPPYDGVMLMGELELFREWFCEGIMGLALDKKDNAMLDQFFDLLVESALSQTQVCVHRDYHSRNLMYQQDGNHGVLDFQDAVVGPVTYDLVSLIKDCYISWPKPMIREWALQYANLAQTAGILDEVNNEKFLHDLDLMGVQRHLKATGIFSRLYLRDGKPGYLADIPRTLTYVKEVLSDYPDFYPLGHWFEKKIYPMLWTRLRSIVNGNKQ